MGKKYTKIKNPELSANGIFWDVFSDVRPGGLLSSFLVIKVLKNTKSKF